MDETLTRRVGLRREEPPSPAESRRAPDAGPPNAYLADPVLAACLDAVLDEPAEEDLQALGAYWGSAEAAEVARLAVTHQPSLRREDFEGRRIDQIEMHPASHALMNRSVMAGLLSSAWEEGEGTRQHRLRAATLFVTAGGERGHLLPLSATHAAVASLAYAPELEAELFPLIAAHRYDRRAMPLEEKDSALITLAISERGPLDEPDAIRTRGELSAGDTVRVTGEKVFVCAPSADMLLTLTRTADGPTVAMVPRYAPENERAVTIEALLECGGLASQAIGTVAFEDARGRLIGEPGRGLQVLRDVRTLTQLDATIIAAGGERGALTEVANSLRRQSVNGTSRLADPLLTRIVADLALTSAAHTALAIRLAAAFDLAFERDGDHAVARVLTPAARIHVLKSGATAAAEARDLLGVMAMPHNHPAARVPGDLAALGQWDGSADEAARDLALLVSRDPGVLGDALDELGADLGNQNADLIERTAALGREAASDPGLARAFAEQLAMVGAASAMRRNLPRVVADAYMSSRLRGGYTAQYGTLDSRFDAAALVDFIIPQG